MPTLYGVFAATGCVTSVLWLERRRERLGLSENAFWAAIWTMALGAVVGAKGLFVVLGWEHYARGELRFWADFGVGFVFFGGLVGAALAGLCFARVRKLGFARGADFFAVAVPMGHAIGRIGCFFAGCCGGHPPHPVQLYEAAGLALVAWACNATLGRVERGVLPAGSAFRTYLALYGMLRFVLDPLRADGRPERFLGISHQQGIALAMIGVALAWPLLARVARPRDATAGRGRGETPASRSARAADGWAASGRCSCRSSQTRAGAARRPGSAAPRA
jgi:phosphatidylglycerol:prolipoprotein diacylglycerol transferase